MSFDFIVYSVGFVDHVALIVLILCTLVATAYLTFNKRLRRVGAATATLHI